jgi:tetratricopeptide (TPR) repeat protein
VFLSGSATPVEKALIAAMQVRYSTDTMETRATLNQAYADAMEKAFEKFPATADVMALYADAMMLQHPWDLWKTDGTPKPWTPKIRNVLEKTLAVAPLHPGANHYYIHVMEPSPYAAKASASADRLGTLTPGLSHMVHMPSHIYLRTGQYNKGSLINENAVSRFKEYSTLFPAVKDGAFLYQLHNQHMQVNCALLAGRYSYALQTAVALQQEVDTAMLGLEAPFGAYMQYVHMTPVLINIRFEKWDSLLTMSKPDARYVYASVLYHFGRGMALTARNNIEGAREEAEQMKKHMHHEELKIAMKPFSAPVEGALCASEILDGFMALKNKKFDAAAVHFTKAVDQEKAMVYNEPRDWLLNPNPYLGTAYLHAGHYAKAEQAFKADLAINDQNVWSLRGLARA